MPRCPKAAAVPVAISAPCGGSRIAILHALFEGIGAGRVATPQERLDALSAKSKRDRWLARFRDLSVNEQGSILLRLASGDDPAELLP